VGTSDVSSAEGYALEWTDEAKSQCRSLPRFSRSDRIRLFYNVHEQLSRVSDDFRNDPENRDDPGATEFRWVLIFTLDNGDPATILFVVDDQAAVFGRLQIISVQLIDSL